ncbi:hypothetical protein [Desulfofundulus sp.]|uniref:hypothetical protein n=1 Tax=Desulfofundulus sp. TaxID=2282750 RepID=UPI003C712815
MDILQKQKRANFETRDRFAIYETHRKKSTELILSRCSCGKILIIGAGNCNDVDLTTLCEHFEQVHLLDIDEDALRHGLRQLGSTPPNNVFLHIEDVTQILPAYQEMIEKPYSSTIRRTMERLSSLSFPSLPYLKESFNIVVSQCLLSQLVHPAVELWRKELNPSTNKLLKNFVHALSASHLKEMASYLSKGNIGIVITDVVSSDDVGHPISEPQSILEQCYFDQQSDFHGSNLLGTNLVAVYNDFRKELSKIIRLEVHKPTLAPSWKWIFSEAREYIVQAFVFQRI